MSVVERTYPIKLGNTAVSIYPASVFKLLNQWHRHCVEQNEKPSFAFMYDEEGGGIQGWNTEFILRIAPFVLKPTKYDIELRISALLLNYTIASDKIKPVLEGRNAIIFKSDNEEDARLYGYIFQQLETLAPHMTYKTKKNRFPFTMEPAVYNLVFRYANSPPSRTMHCAHAIGPTISENSSTVIVPQHDGTYTLSETSESGVLENICEHKHSNFSELAEWLQKTHKKGEILCPKCAVSAGINSQFIIAGIIRPISLTDASRNNYEMSVDERKNKRVFYTPNNAARGLVRQTMSNETRTKYAFSQFPSIIDILEGVRNGNTSTQVPIVYKPGRDIGLIARKEKSVIYVYRLADTRTYAAPMLHLPLAVKIADTFNFLEEQREENYTNRAMAYRILRDICTEILALKADQTRPLDLTVLENITHFFDRNYRKEFSSTGVSPFIAEFFLLKLIWYAINRNKSQFAVVRSQMSGQLDNDHNISQLLFSIYKGNSYGPSGDIWQIQDVEAALNIVKRADVVVRYEIPPQLFISGLLNHDNVTAANDISAGLKVSALVHSGMSPAFTTVVDYFIVNRRGSNNMAVVMERGEMTVKDYFPTISDRLELKHSVCVFKSILAQVLLALETSQSRLKFTHYDLHTENVMLFPLKDRSVEYLQFRRIGHGNGVADMFIPTGHIGPHIIKFIDFGRSRCDDGMLPQNTTPPAIPSKPFPTGFNGYWYTRKPVSSFKFNSYCDMRVFAWDMAMAQTSTYRNVGDEGAPIWGRIPAWKDAFHNNDTHDPDDHRAAMEILDVLGHMTGVNSWTNQTNFDYKSYMNGNRFFTQVDAIVKEVVKINTATRRQPGAAMSYLVRQKEMALTNQILDDALTHLRIHEMYGICKRDPSHYDGTTTAPSEILNLPFFNEYRVQGNTLAGSNHMVDFIADATRSFNEASDLVIPQDGDNNDGNADSDAPGSKYQKTGPSPTGESRHYHPTGGSRGGRGRGRGR